MGDGPFQAAVSYTTRVSVPFSVTKRDFNGDGKLDLVTANAFWGPRPLKAQQRERALGKRRRHLPGSRPTIAVRSLSDLGERRRTSTATGSWTWYGQRRQNSVGVLLGNGDGTFRSRQLRHGQLSALGD